MRVPSRVAYGTVVALVLLLVVPVLPVVPAPAATGGDAVDATCSRQDVQVRLDTLTSDTHRIAGWLCGRGLQPGQTVLIVSPTGLSTHAYWDWPVEKDTYSFVRHATAAGLAVFNYDRLGTGQSDRPPAALVSVPSEAYVLHQLVQALRSGSLGGVPFDRVVLAGNSLSTLISIYEAEFYQDVDGLLNTGVFVGPSPVGLAKLFAAFYPAQFDPKFAGQDIPPGYATTQPGSRNDFFHLPTADAATVALDEALKDTATLGEAATFGAWIPFTHLVDVPVLSLMGDHDVLFCVTVCTPDGPEATKERLFWGPATCLELHVLPEAGHFLQLQPASAAATASLAFDWIARRVGTDRDHPPSAPCNA